MEELISVVIPSYNREKTIAKAVDSVLKQTYDNIEVIVVDDCSTDNTVEILKQYEDPRLHYYVLEKNSGACYARNYGISKAKGKYVALHDSDDIWHSDKLEKQIAYLKKKQLEFMTCGFIRYRNGKQEKIGMVDCPKNAQDLWCQLVNGNWVSTQTILCYRYCFEKIQFDPNVKRFQDWELGLQAAINFRVGSLKETLVDVYVQEDSITNNQKTYSAICYILNKHYSDIEPGNQKMLAQWLKSRADAEREVSLKKAAKFYFQSFCLVRKMKTFASWLMCITGTMKLYLKHQDS